MELVDFNYLTAIQKECASAQTDDPEAVLDWVEQIGVDKNEFGKFMDMVGRGATMAASAAMTMGATPDVIMRALFACGFEMGVRYQQSREVKV